MHFNPLLPVLALVLSLCTALGSTQLDSVPFRTIDGKESSLKEYSGKVVMIVNVASRCGNTPQYSALEKLFRDHASEGLVILGFPCNDFGGQEPGSNEEIKAFCTSKYQVTFPILDKIHVKGPEQAPLYAALTGADAKFPGDVKWNFGKFLIGRNGEVIARFEPSVKPDSPEVSAAIRSALRK